MTAKGIAVGISAGVVSSGGARRRSGRVARQGGGSSSTSRRARQSSRSCPGKPGAREFSEVPAMISALRRRDVMKGDSALNRIPGTGARRGRADDHGVPDPVGRSSPFDITAGAGRRPLVHRGAGKPDRRVTPEGVVTEYPIPTAGASRAASRPARRQPLVLRERLQSHRAAHSRRRLHRVSDTQRLPAGRAELHH